ncbi:Prefoldin subunit [Novymonas esmeraldas]|uniref:Prefoldin subunit n=1 Tax=Novymonas esmeraldas TaxID=1808958 RepID=A0AAW0FBD2_9TRYP
MQSDDDYGDGEVLTGAELYLYLQRQNETRLQQAQDRLSEYAALQKTLGAVTERSRRRVLAPVAGGLAYFAAELDSTNTILVLLGDGWFVERSAVQAAEIAGRRMDFLRREAEVLQQEQRTLAAKQDLFLSELPEAHAAVADLLARREKNMADALASSLGAPVSQPAPPQATSAPCSSTAPQESKASRCGTGETAGDIAAPTGVTHASRESGPAPLSPAEAPLDHVAIDAALATFDELDELTEDELIALEAELGERVNDDEYVERVMTERMIVKKERRVRAELERRGGTATAPPVTDAASAVAARGGARAAGHDAAVVVAAAYRTPGEIGKAALTCLHESGAVGEVCRATPPATSSCTSEGAREATAASPRREKRVHFADEVHGAGGAADAVEGSCSHTTSSPGSAELPAPRGVVDSPPTASPSVLRSTYTIGDIVEHNSSDMAAPGGGGGRVAGVAAGVAGGSATSVPPPPLPAQRQKPKRKSLFLRELEGDDT